MVRKSLLLAGAIGLSIALLESGARLEYRFSTGNPFPAAAFRERLAPAGDADLATQAEPEHTVGEGGDEGEPALIANKVLHPYTGYVHDHSGAPKSTNRFGYPGLDPLWPPTDDEVRIVITGGSVALQLFKEGGRRLREALGRHPMFANRKIRLIALTLGGYKQPQQLMSLAWFLSLGAHFDAVINLDGFNEVVLPYSDNVPDGVHPAFPRSWKLYAQKSLDGPEIDALIEVRTLETRRHRLRQHLGTGVPASSAFVLRVLDRLDQGLAVVLAEAEERFRRALDAETPTYQVSGPPTYLDTEEALFGALISLWESSSRQLHRLCDANGIAYFHFLQPNQYVEGSKPFSGDERRVAIRSGSFPQKTAVRATYAALAQQGATLRADGIRFTDLTYLFATDSETVYKDSCCHFNQRGVDAIVDRIAQEVAAGLAERPLAPRHRRSRPPPASDRDEKTGGAG